MRPFSSAFLIVCLTASAFAQPQLADLRDPAALTIGANEKALVFERASGWIVIPHDGQPLTIVDSLLGTGPDRYTSVSTLVIREKNVLSIVGLADGMLRLMTYELADDKPATAVQGLSGDFPVASAGEIKQLLAVGATDFAIYAAIAGAEEQYALLRIPMGRSKLGKPSVLLKQATGTSIPSAMTVSSNGHLVIAMAESGAPATLRFHHAETGRILLDVPTDVDEIRALCYDAAGALYAAAAKNQLAGVYRLDVAFDGTRQVVRATEMAQIQHVVAIAGPPSGGLLVLVGGEEDGRLLKISWEAP